MADFKTFERGSFYCFYICNPFPTTSNKLVFTLVSIPAVIIMQWNETGLRPLVQCVKISDIIIGVFFSTPEVSENNLKKEHMVHTNIFQYTS